MKPRSAAIGLKTRTGRAIAVALSGPASAPEFICREELALARASIPKTLQPFHSVMEMPWSESLIAVQPTIAAIEKIAADSLLAFLRSIESRGFRVKCIAVVGPADRKLERIGNPHIRAHAAEGVLFRAVVEKAALACDCRSRHFVDPAQELDLPAREVKSVLARLGKIAGSPWRAEEKSAAMAAWVALGERASRPL